MTLKNSIPLFENIQSGRTFDKRARKPRTLEELQQEIKNACGNISMEIIQNVCCSIYGRFEKCIITRGGHFEPL